MGNVKKRIYLSSPAGKIRVQNIRGIIGLEQAASEWETESGYLQDGAVLGAGRYQERNVTLRWDVESREAVREISRVTGKQVVRLEIEERSAAGERAVYRLEPCRVSSALRVTAHGQRWFTCSLQLTAADPYIKKEVVPRVLTGEDAGKVYENDRLYYREDVLTVSRNRMELRVFNNGDTDTPMSIRFAGPADNPWLENALTGERIGVNLSIGDGETVTVHTGYGKKRLLLTDGSGVTRNVFSAIAEGSVFPMLHPGENLLRYGSAGGADAALTRVQIDYAEQYAGYLL